jgi:hypothetical protein
MIITLVQGTRLDALLPRYDFSESHSRVIRAESSAVYPAFKTLTLHEMTVSRVLFAGPSLPDRLVGRNGLPSERDSPPLDQFLDLGFVVLADVPGEELVVGTIDKMRRGDGGDIVTPCNAQQFQAFGKGVREDGRDVPLHRSAQRNHNDMYRDSRCGDRLSGAAPLWPLLAANSRLQRSCTPRVASGPIRAPCGKQ